MSEQPITSLEDAVTALGALPMPAGPVPQPLSDGRFAEIRSRRFDEVTAGPWLVADGVDGPLGEGWEKPAPNPTAATPQTAANEPAEQP